jgi:F420-dependent oxidoreductase-like protein
MSELPIGLAITRPQPQEMVNAVRQAEEGSLYAAWSTVGGAAPDAVTILALAAAQSRSIRLGTSIVPAYPRHPIVLAAQTEVIASLAPGRFRLGIGPSHRPTIEGSFGIPMQQPLVYMREYLTVLRQLLWDGKSDFDGEYLQVHAALPAGTEPPRTPIMLSALRERAFHQAGEISDGAISWVVPLSYLESTALPALRAGAEAAGRPVPPLIAHVPVAMSGDESAVRDAARSFLSRYARLPFYARMFEAAGFPVEDGNVSDALIDGLVVWGDGPRVVERLQNVLAAGAGEVLVSLLPMGTPEHEETDLIDALANAS